MSRSDWDKALRYSLQNFSKTARWHVPVEELLEVAKQVAPWACPEDGRS